MPETIEINEEILADNFDLPKTFILEFEFKLELKGFFDENILVGKKFEKFSVIVFKPLGVGDTKSFRSRNLTSISFQSFTFGPVFTRCRWLSFSDLEDYVWFT